MANEYVFQFLGKSSPVIFSVHANSLMDALDAFYAEGLQKLLPGIGNTAGVIVDRANLMYDPEALPDVAMVSLITRGSPLLAGYDPVADTPQDTHFRIMGLVDSDGDISQVLPWETTLPDGFDPLAHDNAPFQQKLLNVPHTIGGRLGMFQALADECISHYGTVDTSSLDEEMEAVSDLYERPQTYLAAQLLRVLACRPAKNRMTDAIIKKMRHLLFELADVQSFKDNDQVETVKKELRYYRYVTQNYFYRVNQITALEHYRTQKGLSFAQLAEQAGISDRQIRNYERTPYSMLPNVKHGVLTALAKALDVSTDALLHNGKTVMWKVRD